VAGATPSTRTQGQSDRPPRSAQVPDDERRLQNQINAIVGWAHMSPAERAARTAAARAARDAKRALQVDPDGTLDPRERARRVKQLEKAEMLAMRLAAMRTQRASRGETP
jgi:predicted TIM-barrel fold metal-dependent hydrolase